MSAGRCLLLALLLVGLAGCGNGVTTVEWGAGCSDGKDNDGDGLIDCKDPDCSSNPLCGGHPDLGRRDLSDGLVLLPDHPRPDQKRDDLPPANSYGAPCNTSSSTCSDGKPCIPGEPSPSGPAGYCTLACSSIGAACPDGPGGSFARCLFTFNGQPYCAFLCKYTGEDHPCPSTLTCYGTSSVQRYCWPQ